MAVFMDIIRVPSTGRRVEKLITLLHEIVSKNI